MGKFHYTYIKMICFSLMNPLAQSSQCFNLWNFFVPSYISKIKRILFLILSKSLTNYFTCRVEIPETKVTHDNLLEYDDMEIPLPIDQDSYQNTRPYPCDFCSRRFRKKANLMNHIVAHQTDRPYGCNLCGSRYVRKCDLNNHLKVHAYAPSSQDGLEDDLNDEDSLVAEEEDVTTSGNKGRRKKVQSSAPRKRKNNTAAMSKRNVEDVKIEMGKYVYKSDSDYKKALAFYEDELTDGLFFTQRQLCV